MIRPDKKEAFTLIELLVVIAIIALLLSIILPALRKTKDQAKFTVCKTGLHQYGLAAEMYLNDNDEYFPSPYAWLHNFWIMPSSEWACAWHNTNNNYDVVPEKAGTMWPYIDSKKIHVCPKLSELAKPYGHFHRDHDPSIPIVPQYGYCTNGFLGTQGDDQDWYCVMPKKSLVKAPASIFQFAEENTWFLYNLSEWSLNNNHLIGRTAPYNPEDYCGAFGSFHQVSSVGIAKQVEANGTRLVDDQYIGVSNAVFLDGHLEVVHPKDTFRLGWPK